MKRKQNNSSNIPTLSGASKRRKTRIALLPNVDSDDENLDAVKLETRSTRQTRVIDSSVSDSDSDIGLSSKPACGTKGSKSITHSKFHSSSAASHKETRLSSDSDSDSDAVVTLKRRKRRKIAKGKSRAYQASESEQSDGDLVKELDPDSDDVLEERLRVPKLSKFSEGIERMKRKKAARKAVSVSSEIEHNDTSSGSSSDLEGAAPFKNAVPPGGRIQSPSQSVSSNEAEDEEGFIIEDDEEPHEALPLQFSMSSHADLAYHFKVICQLFVHIAVTAPSKRSKVAYKLNKDDYFSVPLLAVRKKTQTTNDSMVASSIWKPGFRKSLDTHPTRKSISMDFSVPLCDACRIGGRVATISLQLSGKPYDTRSFQSIEDDSSDEASANNSTAKFALGRFCAQRAKVYHSLVHWEYSLFKRLEEDTNDLRNPEGSSRGGFIRTNWGDKALVPRGDDLNNPDVIAEWFVQRGVIQDEYNKLKNTLESATALQAPGYGD